MSEQIYHPTRPPVTVNLGRVLSGGERGGELRVQRLVFRVEETRADGPSSIEKCFLESVPRVFRDIEKRKENLTGRKVTER